MSSRWFRFVLGEEMECELQWRDYPGDVQSELFETPEALRSIPHKERATEPAFFAARARAREIGYKGMDCDSVWRDTFGRQVKGS